MVSTYFEEGQNNINTGSCHAFPHPALSRERSNPSHNLFFSKYSDKEITPQNLV
jgi:hypothetical protein